MHQELMRNASEQERRKQVDINCAAWTISHKQGPMYWLRNCTKTENYQWKEQDSTGRAVRLQALAERFAQDRL